MARNIPFADEIGKRVACSLRKFRRFAERQDALRVKGNGKLSAKPLFDLRLGQPDAVSNRLGNIEMKGHEATAFILSQITPGPGFCHALSNRARITSQPKAGWCSSSV